MRSTSRYSRPVIARSDLRLKFSTSGRFVSALHTSQQLSRYRNATLQSLQFSFPFPQCTFQSGVFSSLQFDGVITIDLDQGTARP
jgi:hypothetical protein